MTILGSHIFGALFEAPYSATVFSDDAFVGYCLQVEVALANVQAHLGIIPTDAASKISLAVAELQIDIEAIRASTEKSGVPIINLVEQLRQKVADETASYVHWGATSQDIIDTALVLQIRAILDHFETLLHQLILSLSHLADKHRHTLMVGRTHSQQALPMTFGLKVANWLVPLLRHRDRLAKLKPDVLTLQLGGAVGTLASLGDQALAVQENLASELDLNLPLLSWHTQRDTLVDLANWLSLVSGTLAKMAQDIILMTQNEVGELRESNDQSRGGSSTMPQKSNPIMSEIIIAAARANANHLSSMHHALIQEHERATHGWQLEWLTLPQMFSYVELVLNKAIVLSQNLVVDEARMMGNLAASNGLLMGEAISLALAPIIGRTQAKQLIKNALPIVISENRHLVDVLREQVEADIDWEYLKDERNYLGASQAFIDRVLEQAT